MRPPGSRLKPVPLERVESGISTTRNTIAALLAAATAA
jgi:hypothetical protein